MHIVGRTVDQLAPAAFAAVRRKAGEIRCPEDAGIGRLPGLDIDPGDRAGIARLRGADRDFAKSAHRPAILPGFVTAGEGFGQVVMARLADYLCGMKKAWLPVVCAIAMAGSVVPGHAAKKHPPKPAAHPNGAAVTDPGPAKSLGSAGGWTAYLAENKAGKVCYLVGHPEKSEPAALKRQPAMAMVTHRTEDNVSNVVSFDEGYPLNEEGDVIVEVGREKFPLFAKNDTAWARTSELDRTIVAALSKERQAVVKASPKKGRATTDIYSLNGFAKALALIDKACDVKR
ncbi:MAG TPA: invasion associated locus B family protein [Stellaceae bacterium]|nr:invasion associated locus B family protein [Stellaceae bacterium]